MKRIILLICSTLITLSLCSTATANTAQNPFLNTLSDSTQLVVVTTKGWSSHNGTLTVFQRKTAKDTWKQKGKPSPVVVGQNGLAWTPEVKKLNLAGPYKKEGDKRSPAGAFALGPAFGFDTKANQTSKLYYLPIKKTTVCVEDSASKYYGRVIDTAKIPAKDWNSALRMHDIKQFARGIVVDYNMAAPMPKAGSCVFMHVWKNPKQGTQSCTAMPSNRLNALLQWLNAKRSPVLVQLPASVYQQVQQQWGLPKINRSVTL